MKVPNTRSMLNSLVPSELLLIVALVGAAVVLLSLNCLADLLQESSRWEQVRARLRRKQRVGDGEPAQPISGEVIDAPMP